MLTRFTDFNRLMGWPEFDRAFSLLDAFRREAGRRAEEGFWPRTETGAVSDLYDAGNELIFMADVPGLSENDIEVNLHQDTLLVSGERQVEVPEGYSVHRRERSSTKFSRSFTLGCPVDPERATAQVKNGVLTIRLPKAPEAQPRRISVKTG